jgi:predicted  nucleic acid-binding Zn-ribbon protein
MQLRCTFCQTMFAISNEEMLAGLEHMEERKLAYYDAHCPKCRRANRVERTRMERFFPDWKKAIKTMSKEADQAAGQGTPKAEKKSESETKTKVAPKAVKKTATMKKS